MSENSRIEDLLDEWETERAGNRELSLDEFIERRCSDLDADAIAIFRGQVHKLAYIDEQLAAGGRLIPDPGVRHSTDAQAHQSKLVSRERFLEQLKTSRLISATRLAEAQSPAFADNSAEELAREFVRQGDLTKFQAQHLLQGKGKALVLGSYTVLDKIGAGGMGQVFKAQHERMDRVVAIKLLPPGVMRNAMAVARFAREVKSAAKLLHPNIVTAFDADQANGNHFLVMEYVEGCDLSALVKTQGPLSVPHAVEYILQAARGLEFAHKKGVIHRDIKPGNLLLSTEGTVKILDMGLARIESLGDGDAAPADLTSSGAIMGTVDYMSPEQAFRTKSADARSDIYSLGCSLHYLLTGRPLYDGESVVEKILAHREKPIPLPRDARTDVSEKLELAFCKMVAKRPETRYQSMTAVISDLQAVASLDPTAVSIPTIPPPVVHSPPDFDLPLAIAPANQSPPVQDRANRHGLTPATETVAMTAPSAVTMPHAERSSTMGSRPAGPRSTTKLMLAGLTGAGVALLAVGAVLWNRHEEPTSPIVHPVRVAAQLEGNHDPANGPNVKSSATPVASAPNTPPVNPVAPPRPPSSTESTVSVPAPSASVQANGQHILGRHVMTGHRGNVYRVAISRDGNHALSAGDDGTARFWDLRSGSQVQSLDHPERVFSAAISDDGSRALTGGGSNGSGNDNSVRLWDLATGTLLKRLSGHAHVVHFVGFLPDGQQAISAGLDYTVRVWDLNQGVEQKKFGDWQDGTQGDVKVAHMRQIWSAALSPDGRRLLAGCRNGMAHFCEVTDGREISCFQGQSCCFSSVAISPDGLQAVGGSYGNESAGVESKAVFIWDLARGITHRKVDMRDDLVWSIAYVPNSKYVLTGLQSGYMILWDLTNNSIIDRVKAHDREVRSVAVSADGRAAVSSSDDETVRSWELRLK